jgi:hypothetical protein
VATERRALQPSAAWRSTGDVIDDLITVVNVDDAHVFLPRA